MCLAIPGKLLDLSTGTATAGPYGTVDFQGSRVQANLSLIADPKPGDWLLVHAGFAIARVDESEAREVWEILSQDEQFAAQMPPELRQPLPNDRP